MKREPLPFDYLPPVSPPYPEPTRTEKLILSDERLYGDGPPQWLEGRSKRLCQTAADAAAQRRLLVKRLRRFGRLDPRARPVVDRLDSCAPNTRCLSGACPECARAWQRWFTAATQDFLAHATPAGSASTILSPVHTAGIVEPEELCP